MVYKKLKNIPEFLAGDHTHLKEVLHPSNDSLALNFSLAHAYLKVEEQSLPHRLSHSETYFILDGFGEIYLDGKMQTRRHLLSINLPTQNSHFITYFINV